MTITVGTQTNSGNQANQPSPFTWQHSTDADTVAVAVVVTIYDTSSSDGVVSGITYDGKTLTLRLVEYDATCDGHLCIGERINADVASITNGDVVVSFGGTVTDFVAEIINIETTGGSLEYDSVDAKNVGNGSPMTTSWSTVETSEDCIAFGVGLNDQSKSGTIAITVGSDLYIMDVGSDNVFAGYNIYAGGTATATLTWTESDADEDFIVTGCAYVEAVALAQVNKDLQAKWDINNLVNKDIEAQYDIDVLVNKDLEAKYDIFVLVNKDLQGVWDITELVYKDIQAVWDMEGAVSKDLEAQYDILNLINKDIEAQYDIFDIAGNSLQAQYDILNLVSKDIEAVWDIESSLNQVNKDLEMIWDLLGAAVGVGLWNRFPFKDRTDR